MTTHEEESTRKTQGTEEGISRTEQGQACDDIEDPVRRSLCKVCEMPVIGEAPFCKDHMPPVQ